MLTIACAVAAIALGGVLILSGYIVGRARRIRGSEGYLAGRMEGIRRGRDEGLRERDALREERDDLVRQVSTLLAAVHATAAEQTCDVDAAYEDARQVTR